MGAHADVSVEDLKVLRSGVLFCRSGRSPCIHTKTLNFDFPSPFSEVAADEPNPDRCHGKRDRAPLAEKTDASIDEVDLYHVS